MTTFAYRKTWGFKTKTFEVVCEAFEPSFLDPLALGQDVFSVLDVPENRAKHPRFEALTMVVDYRAVVYRHSVEVGRASLRHCIHVREAHLEEGEGRELVDISLRPPGFDLEGQDFLRNGIVYLPEGEGEHKYESAIVIDPSYFYKVVRLAIRDARKTYSEIESHVPGLYLRGTV
jgi:hypothetical protein